MGGKLLREDGVYRGGYGGGGWGPRKFQNLENPTSRKKWRNKKERRKWKRKDRKLKKADNCCYRVMEVFRKIDDGW